MSRCIPLAALSLCTFAGPLACASGPASGTPSSPRSGSSASVSSGAEAEPPGDHACRAIINVDGAFFDVHMFGDGREARTQRGEGNLMVVDDRVFSVQAMTFGKRLATSQVSLQELPRGLTHEFLSYGVFGASPADLFDYCAANLDNPDGGGPTSECYAGHEMEGSLAPIAFLGPYLSLSGGAFGYTGGAHGIDEAQLGVWNIGADGAKQAAAVALDDLLTQQQLDLAKLAIDGYEIEGFGYDEGETYAYEPGLEDVTGWSLSLSDAGALDLELSIGCCSWS